MDAHCTGDGTLVIYGSAAVALLTADEASEYGFTDDIDIARASESLRSHTFDPSHVDPPLHLQFYDVERWLVHPDWEASIVNFSDLLEVEHLRVFTLHPLDLITTKLERAADQDIEDCLRLCLRFELTTEIAEERVEQAAKFYPLSRRAADNISYAFESIFDVRLDLGHLL